MKWNLVRSIYGRSPILYSLVWPDRSSQPQSIALEASTLTITLPMRFPIFILFLLIVLINFFTCGCFFYNIKRKKYKTVCAELAFAKWPSTEWSWFCVELVIFFTIYRTRGEHANHYATDAVPYFYFIFINRFNQFFFIVLQYIIWKRLRAPVGSNKRI
jgi:hypothetical protein